MSVESDFLVTDIERTSRKDFFEKNRARNRPKIAGRT